MRSSRLAWAFAISPVRSVDALSEIISSKSVKVWFRIEYNVSSRKRSPLYTKSPILTRGVKYIRLALHATVTIVTIESLVTGNTPTQALLSDGSAIEPFLASSVVFRAAVFNSLMRPARRLRLEDAHPTCWYVVVICRNDILGDGGKVGNPQEVAQRRTGRSAVRVGRAALADHVVNIDSPKVDAPTHHIGSVRHGRVKLGSGKDDDPARRDHKPHLRLEFQRFLRVRLHAGIAAYVLRSILPAFGIPSVVIKSV